MPIVRTERSILLLVLVVIVVIIIVIDIDIIVVIVQRRLDRSMVQFGVLFCTWLHTKKLSDFNSIIIFCLCFVVVVVDEPLHLFLKRTQHRPLSPHLRYSTTLCTVV